MQSPENSSASRVEVTLRLNGQDRTIAQGTTISGLLADLGLQEDQVAVELDREIAPRAKWASTALDDGASVEVVHFVGGG